MMLLTRYVPRSLCYTSIACLPSFQALQKFTLKGKLYGKMKTPQHICSGEFLNLKGCFLNARLYSACMWSLVQHTERFSLMDHLIFLFADLRWQDKGNAIFVFYLRDVNTLIWEIAAVKYFDNNVMGWRSIRKGRKRTARVSEQQMLK